MKLNQSSTPQQTFKHPWYTYNDLKKPNPPTEEANLVLAGNTGEVNKHTRSMLPLQ